MIVSNLFEMSIIGVFDRGIPNKERIAIEVQENIDLGQYGIMIGIKGEGNSAVPIRDNLFWFGDGLVNKGDWIFIYTGPGSIITDNIPNTEKKLYAIHWNRKNVMFSSSEVVPILFRIDAVVVDQKV